MGGIDSDAVFGVLDASRGRFFGIPIVRGVVVQGENFMAINQLAIAAGDNQGDEATRSRLEIFFYLVCGYQSI